MTATSGETVECPGSGTMPKRWPEFSDHQKVECPVCDVKVAVYLRTYGHHRRPRDLIVSRHDIPNIYADLCGSTVMIAEGS